MQDLLIHGLTGQSAGGEFPTGTGVCIQVQTGCATSPMPDLTVRRNRFIKNHRKEHIQKQAAGLPDILPTDTE